MCLKSITHSTMQSPQNTKRFDSRKVELTLINENQFITDLFSVLSLPKREENAAGEASSSHDSLPKKENKPTRAKSLVELQERLQAITSKKHLTYKEKLKKKSIKNRMKKKTKSEERNAKQKLARAQKLTNGQSAEIKTETEHEKPETKPVFNRDQGLVFSKIDVGEPSTVEKKKKKNKKDTKDPKKLLENLKKQKEELEVLEEEGELEKLVQIKEKTAWKNALAKAEGQKVKDDPALLKKTIQRHDQKKKVSKKKWEARVAGVEKSKQERQTKRKENIDKRKKDKQKKKFKSAEKRGRVVL